MRNLNRRKLLFSSVAAFVPAVCFAQGTAPAVTATPAAPPPAAVQTSGHWFQVSLRSDGNLAGTVFLFDPETGRLRAAPGTHVQFVRRNQSAGAVVANENGKFTLPSINPGVYSVIQHHPEYGFAAFTVRVYPFGDAGGGGTTELVTSALVGAGDLPWIQRYFNDGAGPIAAAPAAGAVGGPMAGGFGGGGGGGGGLGGGLGALGALGALGGIGGGGGGGGILGPGLSSPFVPGGS